MPQLDFHIKLIIIFKVQRVVEPLEMAEISYVKN